MLTAFPNGTYNIDCTNCAEFRVFLSDVSGSTDLEIFDGSIPFPTSPIAFFSFEDLNNGNAAPAPLLAGLYEIEVGAGFEIISNPSLSGGDSFVYIEETTVSEYHSFSVPEPGAALSGKAVLGTLAALRRRRPARQ